MPRSLGTRKPGSSDCSGLMERQAKARAEPGRRSLTCTAVEALPDNHAVKIARAKAQERNMTGLAPFSRWRRYADAAANKDCIIKRPWSRSLRPLVMQTGEL